MQVLQVVETSSGWLKRLGGNFLNEVEKCLNVLEQLKKMKIYSENNSSCASNFAEDKFRIRTQIGPLNNQSNWVLAMDFGFKQKTIPRMVMFVLNMVIFLLKMVIVLSKMVVIFGPFQPVARITHGPRNRRLPNAEAPIPNARAPAGWGQKKPIS